MLLRIDLGTHQLAEMLEGNFVDKGTCRHDSHSYLRVVKVLCVIPVLLLPPGVMHAAEFGHTGGHAKDGGERTQATVAPPLITDLDRVRLIVQQPFDAGRTRCGTSASEFAAQRPLHT